MEDTFADYILNEENLEIKMDIIYRLKKLLKDRKNITIYFGNSDIFKAEIARMFLKYTDAGKEIDNNLVLTACLLCNCKKPDNIEEIEENENYEEKNADFLFNLGFNKRFCKICKEIKRDNENTQREPEANILELVNDFGNIVFCKSKNQPKTPNQALSEMETSIFAYEQNQYFEDFRNFINTMQEVNI